MENKKAEKARRSFIVKNEKNAWLLRQRKCEKKPADAKG